MFDLCCNSTHKVDYKLLHNPQPIALLDTTLEEIEKLLWYVPNIDSFQSQQLDIIDNTLFNDFIFKFIMDSMGMSEDSDVKWLTKDEVIPSTDVDFFQNSICTNCQKLIICAYSSQTKTKNMLRIIRNSIAHGHFAIADDLLIGFNTNGKDISGNPKYKGIAKISPYKLLNAINKIKGPSAKEHLLGYAFETIGYTVKPGDYLSFGDMRYGFDFLIEKNDKKYYIEVKSYKGERFIHSIDIQKELSMARLMPKDIPLVLIIDSSKSIKEVEKIISDIGTLYIIDINHVRDLLNGNDVLENIIK